MGARGAGYRKELLGAMLLSVALFCMVPVRASAKGSTAVGEFGGLKWGDTVEDALRVYPDLRFKGYGLVREKEAPFQAYVRKRETNKVYGVVFDSLEYRFRGNRFSGIRAVLQSHIGPRTLMTVAERSYETLAGNIRRIYGVPDAQTVKYLTQRLAVVKETTWTTPDATIRLRYSGADEGDADRLMFEMGSRGGAP